MNPGLRNITVLGELIRLFLLAQIAISMDSNWFVLRAEGAKMNQRPSLSFFFISLDRLSLIRQIGTDKDKGQGYHCGVLFG
mmetsp:Transcript_22245/g.25611  ORF Transcript_22245/g.25611 Transcript_22245/m.25611 type:complete len:81 (-) Transcript_22245:176-418(-)